MNYVKEEIRQKKIFQNDNTQNINAQQFNIPIKQSSVQTTNCSDNIGCHKSQNLNKENIFCKKGDTIVIYHKTIRNRRLKITLDSESSIGECKKCCDHINGTNEPLWMVPCDIIGLNDQLISGSKPQKKAIRIRVHPGTLNASQTNSDLAKSVETSSKQLIEQLFGGDWSFEMPNHPDVRVEKLQQLRKLFSNASARISHFKDCVVLNWLFDIGDNNNNNSHNMTMSSALLKSLSLKVSSRLFDDSTKQPKNAHMQIVSLSFIRDGIAEPLVELCFTDLREPKWLKTDRKDHIIDVDKRGFRIHLRKTNTEEGSVPIRRCEHVRAVSFQNDGTTKEMPLIDSQKRIDELRQRLDESLSQFQRHQKLHSNSNHPSKPHNNNIKQRRILSVLCQNTEQTLIQISGTKSLNYLFASPLQSTHNRQSTSPLHLIVGNSNDQSCTGDSLPSSPANSVDSGISSFGSLSNSPSVSPGSSPVYTRNVPFMHSYGNGIFKADDLRMRPRSTSECITSTGLKSILKKPTTVIEYRGRFVNYRSVSECQHSDEREAIDGLIGADTLEGIDESSESLDCIVRKKRVSFSERLVQERSFRPNSSILGQKKKNQRRSRNKLKKKASSEESLNTDDDGSKRDSSEEVKDGNRESRFGGDEQEEKVSECNGDENLLVDNKHEKKVNRIDECERKKEEDEEDHSKSAQIRTRRLRSSTGEENCVNFIIGDTELKAHQLHITTESN